MFSSLPWCLLGVLEPYIFINKPTGMNREKQKSSRENQSKTGNMQNQIMRVFSQKLFLMCHEASIEIISHLAWLLAHVPELIPVSNKSTRKVLLWPPPTLTHTFLSSLFKCVCVVLLMNDSV